MNELPSPPLDGGTIEEQTALATAVVVARLHAGHPTALRVRGRSMYPYLVAGQSVLLAPCQASSLRRGDLVAFERGARVVLHRVLGVDGVSGRVTEKGDNVRSSEVVAAEQVIGRASAVLSPRQVSLDRLRYQLTGRWMADLSGIHAACHRFALHHRLAGKWLARGATVVLRLAGALVRPPR